MRLFAIDFLEDPSTSLGMLSHMTVRCGLWCKCTYFRHSERSAGRFIAGSGAFCALQGQLVSNLTAMASTLRARASNLEAMASTLIAIR